MDISMTLLISSGTLLVSAGIAYGVVKTTDKQNAKDITKLSVEIDKVSSRMDKEIEKIESQFFRRNEWAAIEENLIREITALKKQNEAIDGKREQSRIEHHEALSKIAEFMGRVDEYMRNKG